MVEFALVFGWIAIIINVYIIASYVRCKFGKYPPFINSFGKARKKTLEIAGDLLQEKSKGMRVVDLGCGCGALLLPLAKKFPQHQFVGIEWDIVAYCLMKIRSFRCRNVKVYYGNFLTYDWSDFDLFLCYIGNDIAAKVSEKIILEAKRTAVIISEAFSMPDLQQIKSIEAKTYSMPLKVFVYSLPKS